MNNFLDISQINKTHLKLIISEARKIKASRKGQKNGVLDADTFLDNYQVGLIFEKPSTRTRVSFEVGIRQLGGQPVILSMTELQTGNGESITDTAKVLSLYLDMVLFRTSNEQKLVDFVNNSSIPIINGLTDRSHPCQVMADVMTFEELKGGISGKKVAWVGDGNNVCASYIHAAVKFDFNLRISTPVELLPNKNLIDWAKNFGANIKVYSDPSEAVSDADLVVTDTHLSMHDDLSKANFRLDTLRAFQVNERLMSKAKTDAIFMHCLPAHREVEVTSGVIDGPQSVVMHAAENRLHVQKAIMKWCVTGLNSS